MKRRRTLRFLNPLAIIAHLWRYRLLIGRLTRREVLARYKGSIIGLGWSFIHPLLMLCIYTFVFSVIFQARWGVSLEESRAEFALALFMGIITFNIWSESANAAPNLVLGNSNYVKKVVFPLEILPLVNLLTVLVNALFSLTILTAGLLVIRHFIHLTTLLLPVVWIPIILFTLGFAYFVASLGVFIRDIGATITVLTSMMFFMTPIFFPIRAVPEDFRFIFHVNPLAIFVEDARRVVLWGMMPDWNAYGIGLGFSAVFCILGFVWFMKSKGAFADVI